MKEKLLRLVESLEEYLQNHSSGRAENTVLGFESGNGGKVLFSISYTGKIPVKELFTLTEKLGLEPCCIRFGDSYSSLHVKLKECSENP